MRTISANAQAAINQQYGLESVVIVRVYWNDLYYDYSDKLDLSVGEFGRVLEISGLDDVLSLDNSSTNQSVTVKLDDSGGDLKTIINNVDVHKKRVQILQWFEGLPLEDAIVLFTGYINTPIDWSEGERALTFTVINMVENYELGFSLEEGSGYAIPVNVYDKPFPIVFGDNLKVPAVLIGESPSGILAQGFAYVYDKAYNLEIKAYQAQIDQFFSEAQLLFEAGVGCETIGAGYNDGFDDALSPPDDYQTYLSYHQAAEQYYQQSAQYTQQMNDIKNTLRLLELDYAQKKAFAFTNVQVASSNFPRGVPVVVEIDNLRFNVQFDGVNMHIISNIPVTNLKPGQVYIESIYDRPVARIYTTQPTDVKFVWFDAGSEIRVISVPMYYAACFGVNEIVNVYGRVKGVRVKIPNNVFSIETVTFGNDFGFSYDCQVVVLNRPLTSILNVVGEKIYDSDDIWCDISSSVPGQFVHIMFWTLALFSNLTADPISFNDAYLATINTPMNFCILERKNVYDFIKEVCFQARCAVWVDDTTVRLRYLPAQPVPVETITPDDVVENSLVITCTDTESIITKLVSKWKTSRDQQNYNDFVCRQNVMKYGLRQDQIDMYCYNTQELVERVSIFWLIRKCTAWKLIKLKTYISKLKLESHDPVLLSNFNGLFSNNDVVGVVQSATFDSSNNTIDMEIWLPIRWGEMDPYIFAYPANVGEHWGQPGVADYLTGNPFYQIYDRSKLLNRANSGFNDTPAAPPAFLSDVDISDRPPQQPTDIASRTYLMNVASINNTTPDGLASGNNKQTYQYKDPPPVTIPQSVPSVDFGIVQSDNGDGTFQVQLIQGDTVNVRQVQLAEGYTIPPGVPTVCVKKKGTYYMQVPTWELELADNTELIGTTGQGDTGSQDTGGIGGDSGGGDDGGDD